MTVPRNIGVTSKVLEYIVDFQDKNQYPPSFREIGGALDIKSTATVRTHILLLERLGVLVFHKNAKRSMTVEESKAHWREEDMKLAYQKSLIAK